VARSGHCLPDGAHANLLTHDFSLLTAPSPQRFPLGNISARPLAFAALMKPLLCLLASLLLFVGVAQAQFGSFGDVPIDITSENSRMEAGLAIAEGNVVIQYGTTTIYCDYAQYNPETRDVLVSGNVRIYREGRLFTGERALYNLETKILHAADFRGDFAPFRFGGETLGTLGPNAYIVKDGIFTTSDNSKPDYYLRARTVRIYPRDRIIFRDVMLYVGRTPIFWFPYVYQSLNQEQGFTLTPGYSSVWGAYLLGTYTFPLTENISAKLRLDLLADRGIGTGFESRWGSEESEKNWGRFRSYYINDSNPGVNRTSLAREPIDPSRYRVSFQNRTYFTENIYASIDINKLSDARFLQDFDEGEFRRNPNPDNMIALTKWDEDYTGTLIARKNLNEEHFDMTERLPEGALDMKRQPFFRTPLFYESETSTGFYRRNFAGEGAIADYDTFRADTFHQLSLPKTFFGWLSVVPRVGVRGTYYADSGTFEDRIESRIVESSVPGEPARVDTTTVRELHEHGSLFRPVVNAGVESSFKVSRAWEQAQSRAWGLDGLRHIMQPFANFSYVYSGEDPVDILQFDRLNRSTQLPPIDFPQFNSIDSIDNWTVLRLGVRNRLQTRRDNRTMNWLELNTYFDINFDRPQFLGGLMPDPGTFSNVFNRLRWTPLGWVNLTIDSQLPLLDSGFTEVNSRLNFLLTRNVELNLGHRYLEGNPIINDSNLVQFGGYFRFDDNWAFSFRESYEFEDSVLESQRYELHRDLSSWVASLGFIIRDNRGVNDYGLLLTFTLKDLPNVRLPVALDPEGAVGGGSGKNR
jgi:lipopolysaccharide assembly outer membrane protein LptD (OstA)